MATQTIPSLDDLFNEVISDGIAPGAVAIATTGAETFYHGAYGKMAIDRDDQMTPDAIFRIASMTKAITSVAAMTLVDEGALSLDDLASRYIPRLGDL
jgi:CubicO group peptidase (beta-lactamase class C family)